MRARPRALIATGLIAGLAFAAAGCRAAPPRRDAAHPASPQAPSGRLAGPPAALGAPPADLIIHAAAPEAAP